MAWMALLVWAGATAAMAGELQPLAGDGTIFLPSADRLLAAPPGGSPSVLGQVYVHDTGNAAAMTNPLGLKAHHVTARVRDIGASVAWYRDVLGLAPGEHGERAGGAMRYAVLHLPGFAIALVQLSSPATEVQPGQALLPTWVHPVFSVADPDALYRRFKAQGVRVGLHGPEPDKVSSFLVYDPDGNEIEIVADDTP